VCFSDCVCNGGKKCVCEGCKNQTIVLHEDEGRYVVIDRCPYVGDYTQERFIVDAFGHYKNGMYSDPMHQPKWLNDGIALLTHIVNTEEQRAMERSRTVGGINGGK